MKENGVDDPDSDADKADRKEDKGEKEEDGEEEGEGEESNGDEEGEGEDDVEEIPEPKKSTKRKSS